MFTFLLIHGGSHGAWCWESLSAELHQMGHQSVTLDLPGHGADSTPRAQVTTDAYISRVNQVIEDQHLDDFVIVGHSLAGTILSDIIRTHPQKINECVFLAAYVLAAGEAAIDCVPADRRPNYFEMAERSPENSIMLSFEVARARFFSDLSEQDAHQYYQKLTPQPLAPYLSQALVEPTSIPLHYRYILCKQDQTLSPDWCRKQAIKLGVKCEEVVAGHDVMLSQPHELAQLLVKTK